MPPGHPQYFDLEDPVIAQLLEQPMTALQDLRGLVVIDEAQRQPGLFPVLRVLADRAESPATFLILGSASPELSRQTAESLAGRVGVEFKRADAPRATRSMHLAISDTALDELWVVYPGTRSYALDDRIRVRPLHDCIN